ncbi:hypothetical protein M569_12669, partial [Genlisea aurea]
QMDPESFVFGPYKIDPNEVFYTTGLSYAMVNLRPVLEGVFFVCNECLDTKRRKHVLVCPRRIVKRFVDLSAEETTDLWFTAQKIGNQLETHHKASSLTFTIQDGPQAGQTVPHVHIHVLPRRVDDFENNDDVYDAINLKEMELKKKLDLDKERKDRSIEEMSSEAAEYRKLFI